MASSAGEIADLEERAEQLEDEAMQHERDQQPIAAQAKLQKAKALRDKVLAMRQGTGTVNRGGEAATRAWGHIAVPAVTGDRPQSGVPVTEGVRIKTYKTRRTSFIASLFDRVIDSGVVLIKAAPQTGKTSTMQLMEEELHTACTRHDVDIRMYYVSMLGHKDLNSAMQRAFPQLWPQGWSDFRRVCLSPQSTGAGAEPQQRTLHLLCIDEAQKLWVGHQWLWEELKLGAQQPWRRQVMRLLLAAAYGDKPSGIAADAPVLQQHDQPSSAVRDVMASMSPAEAAQYVAAIAAAAAAARWQAVPAAATPFSLTPQQIIEVLPLSQLEHAQQNNRLTLTASVPECRELVADWQRTHGIALDDDVVTYLYQLTGGQFGALSMTLDFLAGKLVNEAKERATQVACYQLTSASYLQCCSQLRSIAKFMDMPEQQRQLLREMLASNGTLTISANDPEDRRTAALQLSRVGVISPDSRVPSCLLYRFTSPVHEMVLRHEVFHASTSTSDICEFVTAMIERMDARTLYESLGRTPSTGYPLEGVYHLEAARAATPVLPINTMGGKAVLSTFVGQMFGASGFLDMYIGEPHFWGVEFLRDGQKLGEHISRFEPGGAYSKMRGSGLLQAMVVIDLRAPGTGVPRSPQGYDPDVQVVRVCFEPGFRQAVVYGLRSQPLTLQVGGGEPPSSSAVGALMAIRG